MTHEPRLPNGERFIMDGTDRWTMTPADAQRRALAVRRYGPRRTASRAWALVRLAIVVLMLAFLPILLVHGR